MGLKLVDCVNYHKVTLTVVDKLKGAAAEAGCRWSETAPLSWGWAFDHEEWGEVWTGQRQCAWAGVRLKNHQDQ